jgi:hypothetical protein
VGFSLSGIAPGMVRRRTIVARTRPGNLVEDDEERPPTSPKEVRRRAVARILQA